MQLAADRGLINQLTVNAIEGVTVMRNLAVHGPRCDFTTRQVDEYLALIESVIFAIRQNVKRSEARLPPTDGSGAVKGRSLSGRTTCLVPVSAAAGS